ncbi:MAG: RagB/SusD family nutrient uptake outer membrane protein [Bacteroidales bacterium]|nr:RagB/SusD family nutrient uptake outer membrane protein [Bacteroidales bacterium]
MKKYILMAGMAAALGACTDLDTDIKTYYTEFPDNEIAVSSEFEGCYYYHRNEAWFGRNFWEGMFLCTDEAAGICLNADWYDNGRIYFPTVHDFRTENPGVGLMGDMMNGCNYTNQRILLYGGADGTDPIVAPLRAIRAYYHFWMMDIYGDVPLLDHVYDDDEEITRQPRADIAKFIESELLAVIPDLSEENNDNTYGRPNKWMAEALLAKLYLNWGVYTNDITTVTGSTPNEKLNDCVAWCDELINSGVFEIGKGYRKKFFPDNGVQIKDFIYAVPFDATVLDFANNKYSAAHSMMRFCDYRKGTYCSPVQWGWYPNTTRAGTYLITPEAVDRFCLEGDERNEIIAVGEQTVWDSDFNITDEPVIVYNDTRFRRELGPLDFKKDFEWEDISMLNVGAGDDLEVCMKGARCFKYPANPIDDTIAPGNYIGQSNDIPVFRLADIYLMKAECILRGATATNGDTPASLVNAVRDCASAPHCTSITLDELLDERTRELIMEPWRRNDLIRYGKFENCCAWKVASSPASMADVNKRLFPIPSGEMSTNTNWSQNPSY